jgi:ubiquinone/menaquinone biosynthesis C-methylase UbiE
MPDLGTQIHLSMLRHAHHIGQPERDGVYGLHWGDPNTHPLLRAIRDRFIAPYLSFESVACEIGPGGGRWTRYLLSFRELYLVDFHRELLDEFGRNFRAPHLHLIKNSGSDLPGIADRSVDFLFSFGVFVHLDMPIIEKYLSEIRRVLKEHGNAVIQYSDKRKLAAKKNHGFSDNDPDRMRTVVKASKLTILEEDTDTLPHSAVIRLRAGSQ